jgi:hypothetical protein
LALRFGCAHAITSQRDPVFLFEHRRTHTTSWQTRASFRTGSSLDQPLAGARATLMGIAEAPGGQTRRDVLACYLTRF